MDLTRVALDEHFTVSGGCSKVAIDLERRMRIEQVWIYTGTALAVDSFRLTNHSQQISQHGVGAIAIPESGLEIDFPGATPTGALLAAGVQGNAGCLGQLRRTRPRDLSSGIEGEKV